MRPQVVVVGGGPAGAVAAATAAGRGVSVLVLEARNRPSVKIGECLPPSATPLLRQLGLSETMEQQGHLPCLGFRSVWGDAQPVDRDFFLGTRGTGWLLDRRRFEMALEAVARDRGAVWASGWRLSAVDTVELRSGRLQPQQGGWCLEISSEGGVRRVETDFLIDATGRAAVVARKLGCSVRREDPLIGVAMSRSSPSGEARKRRPDDRLTLVEATEDGWWYSALLADGSLVAVFHTDSELLRKGEAPAPAEHTADRWFGHGGDPTGAPRLRPAGGTRLHRAHGERWLAVGDAAVAFDPLSSHGITSAMGTGFYGAAAAADTLEGSDLALSAYQALLDRSWDAYAREHRRQYALETRWPEAPFWRRRRRAPPRRGEKARSA